MRSLNTGKHDEGAGLRSVCTAWVMCLTVIGVSACGGTASEPHTTASHSAPSTHRRGGTIAHPVATWADETQRLCTAKHAAILALGYVHITYGGIERIGLPAAKRVRDHYLVRLLGVLERYEQQQRRLTRPASDVALVASAQRLDSESVSAPRHLESAIGNVTPPSSSIAPSKHG